MANRGVKRRRTDLENQLRDGIRCPPKLSESIKPVDGYLHFSAPSTSHQDVQHKVTIENNSFGLRYTCTCKNTLETFGICKHIRATLIHMMTDLMRYQDDTDKTLELVNALDKFSIGDDEERMNLDSDAHMKYDDRDDLHEMQ